MTKRIYAALISLVALASVEPAGVSARDHGHQHEGRQHAAKRTHKRALGARRRARARRRVQRREVAYVCPMHPDIRERERGTCPKCLMELVAEPRGPKSGGAKTDGAAAPGGM